MLLEMEIEVTKTGSPKYNEVDLNNPEFGKYLADHMLITDYANGKWGTPKIIPFQNLSMSPAMLALHYGQTVFEGMKAFRTKSGAISIFRMDKHLKRFNRSLERMCMPPVPEEIFYEGLKKLVETDRNWVPGADGASLYIRPFMFASEERYGVKISEEYKFIIFSGPVGPYYNQPLRVKVETGFVRAPKGGTGYAKCGGNYGGSFYPTALARKEGYDQVFWTDARTNEYIEESGTMNVLFMIDDVLVTPAISDSILDGVTRDSILTLAREMGVKVEERSVAVAELEAALKAGTLTQAFGAGTAAVVAPIQDIYINGVDYSLPKWGDDCFMLTVKKKLADIRTGAIEDTHHWNTLI